MKPFLTLLAVSLAVTLVLSQVAPPGPAANPTANPSLFAPQNLMAWCVVPFDAKKREPVERAEMLARLGFKHFAYDWRSKDIPDFDAEIDALTRQGINLVAWWFPTDAADPNARLILEVIKRHGIHPQLSVMGRGSPTKTQVEQEERIEQEAARILIFESSPEAK